MCSYNQFYQGYLFKTIVLQGLKTLHYDTIEKIQMTEKHLKMYNILSHQGNANQNHFKNPSYTCKNG